MTRRIAHHIREVALGATPRPDPYFGTRRAANWVGAANQWHVLSRLDWEYFSVAPVEHQRTFLLFVAEDMQ